MHQSRNGVPKKPLEFKQLTIALALTFKQQMKEVQTVTRIIIFTVILIFSFLLQSTMTEREKEQRKWSHERVTNTHFFVNLAHSSVYVHFLLFFGVKNTTHSKYNKGCMYSLHKCTSILVTFQVDLYWESVVVLLTFLRRTRGGEENELFLTDYWFRHKMCLNWAERTTLQVSNVTVE